MNTIGPMISAPWGIILVAVIGILILIGVAELCWHTMPHYPEDDEPWDEDDHFVIQEEDWSK